jgi:hypothetical protein
MLRKLHCGFGLDLRPDPGLTSHAGCCRMKPDTIKIGHARTPVSPQKRVTGRQASSRQADRQAGGKQGKQQQAKQAAGSRHQGKAARDSE